MSPESRNPGVDSGHHCPGTGLPAGEFHPGSCPRRSHHTGPLATLALAAARAPWRALAFRHACGIWPDGSAVGEAKRRSGSGGSHSRDGGDRHGATPAAAATPGGHGPGAGLDPALAAPELDHHHWRHPSGGGGRRQRGRSTRVLHGQPALVSTALAAAAWRRSLGRGSAGTGFGRVASPADKPLCNPPCSFPSRRAGVGCWAARSAAGCSPP